MSLQRFRSPRHCEVQLIMLARVEGGDSNDERELPLGRVTAELSVGVLAGGCFVDGRMHRHPAGRSWIRFMARIQADPKFAGFVPTASPCLRCHVNGPVRF